MQECTFVKVFYGVGKLFTTRARRILTDGFNDRHPVHLLAEFRYDRMEALCATLDSLLIGKHIFIPREDPAGELNANCKKIRKEMLESTSSLLRAMKRKRDELGLVAKETFPEMILEKAMKRMGSTNLGSEWFGVCFKEELENFDRCQESVDSILAELENKFPYLRELNRHLDLINWKPEDFSQN